MNQARNPKPPKNARAWLKTAEVLAATGITHQTLYRYATIGLIEEIDSTAGGHRRFPPETIAAIKLVQGLVRTGYTLRDIKEIFFKETRMQRLRNRRAAAGEASRRPR